MGTSSGMSYESMYRYLRRAEKQIDSTLDVNCRTNPFDCHHNYETISDLQIYCDTLFDHLCHELTELAPIQPFQPFPTAPNKHSLESLTDHKSQSMSESKSQSLASIGSHCSHSPTLLTNSSDNSVNTNANSIHNTSNSNVNTISSTSSDHKPIHYINNNSHSNHMNNSFDFSYHRLSEYENNHELGSELLTAKQLQLIKQQIGTNNNNNNNNINNNNNNINNNNSHLLNTLSKTKQSIAGVQSRASLFGCDLDQIPALNGGLALPPFIEKCLRFLSEKGINSLGIFRKSGVKSRINQLREMAEKGISIEFTETCVYDMADVTKTWFRELKPKQLLTQQIISSFNENKKEFTFCAIPDTQRAILQIILRFLALIASNSNVNQMNCHNLAICLTPSLCECDGDRQLFDAQKCLEFSIENCESLFVISVDLYSIPNSDSETCLPRKHEATALIESSPNDILNRILYERHLIDPTIIEWSIGEEVSPNSDTVVIRQQLSAFLPIKSIIIERNWRINSLNNIEVIENGDLYESRWSVTAQGQGRTLVAHMIALDLRGHSYEWYITTFPTIHNNQLNRLSKSFLIDGNASKVSDI